MEDCSKCPEVREVKAGVMELGKFKDKLDGSEGTIEQLWQAIGKKISLSLALTLMGVILGILSVSYGSLFMIVSKFGDDLTNIKKSIAVIEERIKK